MNSLQNRGPNPFDEMARDLSWLKKTARSPSRTHLDGVFHVLNDCAGGEVAVLPIAFNFVAPCSMNFWIWGAGIAPACRRQILIRLLNRPSLEIAVMRYSVARGSALLRCSPLPTTNFARYIRCNLTNLRRNHLARSATMAPQKSTSTGRVDRPYQRIETPNRLALSTGSPRGGQLRLAICRKRNVRFNAFVLETIALPTFWASHEQSVIVCFDHTHNEVSWLESLSARDLDLEQRDFSKCKGVR